MQLTPGSQVQHWLTELANLRETRRCSKPGFIKPFHLVTLALCARQMGSKKLVLTPDFMQYAQRLNLWGAIGQSNPIRYLNEHPPRGRFLEISRIETELSAQKAGDRLREVVVQSTNADKETADAIRIAFSELALNCINHSGDQQIPGMVCAQYWPGGSLAQVAIADAGVGIRSTLSRNRDLAARLEDENACQMATEYGVTGAADRGHTGYGLTLAKDLATRSGGRLIVCSGNEIFEAGSSVNRSNQISCAWTGAIIVYEWRTNRPLDCRPIYEGWQMAEGYDDEDFVF